MPLADYLAGVAFFVATAGAVSLAAWLVVARRLIHLRGAPRVLAFGLLASAGLIAVHLLPGLVGLLSRASALACAVALLTGIALALRSVPPRPDRPWGPSPPAGRVATLLAVAAVAALGAWYLAAAWVSTATPSAEIDTLTFHLPNVARWIQTGSFWRVDQFSPLLANGNYPHNGDVVVLAAVLPWESDAFARLVSIPYAALAGVAVYAIARELRVPRALAALFGAVFVSVPAFVFAVIEGAKTDAIMLATFGAGVLFLLRHFRTDRRSDLVLAGIGLGIAFGTKWYGVSSVVAVLAVWVVAWLAAGRHPRALLHNLSLVAALAGLSGGFWLVRNLVESGNPVFPAELRLLGTTIFDAPRDYIRECAGGTIADYLGSPGVWRHFILPAYEATYGLPGALLAGGLLVAAVLVGRELARRSRLDARHGGRLLTLLVLTVCLAGAYAVTPYSGFGPAGEPRFVGANARWLLPALLVATGVGAGAAARLGRLRALAAVLAFAALADGIRRGFAVPRTTVLAAAVVLALGAAGGRALYARRAGRRRAIVLAGGGLLVALLVAGHLRQERFMEARYTTGDPAIAWFAQNAPAGHRVGLAGVWSVEGVSPVLPAFGPRLGNEVAYVGHLVSSQLREYDTADAFLAAVRRGGYDLLLIGKGGYTGCRVPGAATEEPRWAEQGGYRKLAESERLVLYEVPIEGVAMLPPA